MDIFLASDNVISLIIQDDPRGDHIALKAATRNRIDRLELLKKERLVSGIAPGALKNHQLLHWNCNNVTMPINVKFMGGGCDKHER